MKLHVYRLSFREFLCQLGSASYFASSMRQVERIAEAFNAPILYEGSF